MAKDKKKVFKESIGLDIGTHSIKMVHIKKQHSGFKLVNYEVRSTVPAGTEYIISDLRKERYAPIVAEMMKTMHINPRKVKRIVSSVGGDNTSIKQIKTIFLPEDELDSALFFEAKKHLPISGSDMLLDYQVLSVEEKTNNMNILLASTTRELLNQHTEILSTCGLNPGIVDIEALGVANCFALNTFVEDGTYVILNIGAHKTNMVIYGPQSKFFTRDISWGGYHFTRDLMRLNDMSFEQAEEHKFTNGIKKAKAAGSSESLGMLDITEKTTEEQIALETKRSLRFYVKEAGNSDFRKILLVGGSAKIAGLPEYLQEALNMPVEVYNPFVGLELPDKYNNADDPQFALAIGLAMRPE